MPTTSSHSLPYPDDTDPADVPADIGALAEAVDTKLDAIAPGQITGPTSGQILIANASGVVTGTSVSGDVTISNAGVTEIGAGVVGTTEIANSAVTTAKVDSNAITTAKIAAGAVTAAKIAASTTGSATPGANNDLNTVVARKYADGRVLLSGGVLRNSGTWSAGTTITTLPAGFRPTGATVFGLAWSGTAGANAIQITTTGEVQIRSGVPAGVAASVVTLDGITFHVG